MVDYLQRSEGLELSGSILGGVGVTDRGEMVNSAGTGLVGRRRA
jgi:hypothetical protein